MLASSLGSQPIAELLIRHGANVNAVESFRGQTALMWAAAEIIRDRRSAARSSCRRQAACQV